MTWEGQGELETSGGQSFKLRSSQEKRMDRYHRSFQALGPSCAKLEGQERVGGVTVPFQYD